MLTKAHAGLSATLYIRYKQLRIDVIVRHSNMKIQRQCMASVIQAQLCYWDGPLLCNSMHYAICAVPQNNACYTPCSYQPALCYYGNDIRWTVEIISSDTRILAAFLRRLRVRILVLQQKWKNCIFSIPCFTTMFLNRRDAIQYRALASIIPGRERFSWNLSF